MMAKKNIDFFSDQLRCKCYVLVISILFIPYGSIYCVSSTSLGVIISVEVVDKQQLCRFHIGERPILSFWQTFSEGRSANAGK